MVDDFNKLQLAEMDMEINYEKMNEKYLIANNNVKQVEELLKLERGEKQYVINELHEQLQATYKKNDSQTDEIEEKILEIALLEKQVKELQSHKKQLTKAVGYCPEFMAENYGKLSFTDNNGTIRYFDTKGEMDKAVSHISQMMDN